MLVMVWLGLIVVDSKAVLRVEMSPLTKMLASVANLMTSGDLALELPREVTSLRLCIMDWRRTISSDGSLARIKMSKPAPSATARTQPISMMTAFDEKEVTRDRLVTGGINPGVWYGIGGCIRLFKHKFLQRSIVLY